MHKLQIFLVDIFLRIIKIFKPEKQVNGTNGKKVLYYSNAFALSIF